MNVHTAANTNWRNRPADQRFDNIDALQAAVTARRNISRQVDVELGSLSVEANGDSISIKGDTVPGQPTNWAFGQLAGLVAAPAGYLRSLPTPLAANCLNHGIKHRDNGKLKLLSIQEDDGLTINAVTSPTYGRIWDADVVDATKKILDRCDGKFFVPKDWNKKPAGLYASDRDVFMFHIDGGSLVDGGGDRDQLNRGFYVWNSETGSKAMGISTFLFRHVCGNLLVWGAEDVKTLNIRHSINAPERFINEATPALLEYTSASVKPIEVAVKKAKAFELPIDDDDKLAFFLKRSFTKSEVNMAFATADREEGASNTLWKAIQGFTSHAKTLAFVDARVDLQKRAGKLMEVVA